MTEYSFKKHVKVYLVHGGTKYNIDISEISFNQTITDESFERKTIHIRDLFGGSVITKANPANFELTFPAIREVDLKVVFDRTLDLDTFDLYIQTRQDTFKLEYAVITNANFVIERTRPLSMSVSGEASRLTREGAGNFAIPGTLFTRSYYRKYNPVTYINIVLDGDATLSQDLASITIELQTSINWMNNTIIVGNCSPVELLTFPETFTVDRRNLSGVITRYLTDTNNAVLQDWRQNVSLFIEVGHKINAELSGFIFNITSCVFRNRLNTGEIYTQSYEWRMTQNPTNLSDVISYLTIVEILEAILDSSGLPILDSTGSPLLETT